MEREGRLKKTARIATGLTLGALSVSMSISAMREIKNGESKPSEIIGAAEAVGLAAAGSIYSLNEATRRGIKSFISGGLGVDEGDKSLKDLPNPHFEEHLLLPDQGSESLISQIASHQTQEAHQ